LKNQLPDKRSVLLDALEDLEPDSSHDVHADGHVGRVGQLDSVLGERPAKWAHAERDHVHDSAYHLKRNKRISNKIIKNLNRTSEHMLNYC